MEFICKKLSEGYDSLLSTPYKPGDIHKLAKKYKLTVHYNDGKLIKSDSHGPEVFIVLKHDTLFGHYNPGKLAKLPSGVGKIKGCKYKLEDFLECSGNCDLDTDWHAIEDKYRKGINIWRKISKGLNKSKVVNMRRSKINPAVHLHCDQTFNKLFLITCDKVYFRGNRRILN